MAIPVIMPRQGQSVESCIIGKWYKQKGDHVKAGDILFSYETDKATFEEEAKIDGVLLEVFFEEGDEVEVLKNVCVIGSAGESVEEFRQGAKGDAPPTASSAPAVAATTSHSLQTESISIAFDGAAAESVKTHISPRARALAEKTGADISKAIPSGANNRIMEKDVQKVIADGFIIAKAATGAPSGIAGTGLGGRVTTYDAANSLEAHDVSVHPAAFSAFAPNIPDSQEMKLSSVRKFIATAMHSSLSNSAQLTHHSTFDATDILDFRKNLKVLENRPELGRITVTDIILYATSRVLLRHKSINAHFMGESMTIFNNAHIGLACDTPRGLLVPTIFNANALTLTQVSAATKEKIEKSRAGTIGPDELKGGTFTISNIGGFGIEMFTPVLNPPQTGILGVCSVVERTKSGKVYPAMGLSLTYDHRALDGADAARFQRELMDYLEKFSFNLLMEPLGL